MTEPVVVGKPEIAELCGVDRNTPKTWAQRNVLPEPDHPPVNGMDAWYRTTIEEWKASRPSLGKRQAASNSKRQTRKGKK